MSLGVLEKGIVTDHESPSVVKGFDTPRKVLYQMLGNNSKCQIAEYNM